MRVVYSHAAKFAGAGMGSIAYQFVQAIHRTGYLQRAIISYTNGHDLPPGRVVAFPWMRVIARLARDYQPLRDATFDWLAARFVQPCDIFHGWSHQCLRSLRRAKALGAVTFVERQNSHERTQYRLVKEEFERWGFRGYEPVRPWGMRRGLAEFEVADFITVPSPFAFESMVDEGVPEERLFLIPYGVDTTRFTPGEPPTDAFRLLFVGQVSLRKGVPYLLQAWKGLRLPRAELWLAGRVTPDAERAVAPYRDDSTIRFLGHVRDIPAIYRQACAFVLPSIEEGSALVTYEAMAAGLPLIFTYNSGAAARDGVEGIQVPIRDVDALAAAIEQLYRSPDMRREMGRAGRRRAEEYTWEAAGEQLLAAYREALQRKGKA
ncbi:MAG: glycosyltransferase family 4 protein [Anaerolineae bacterium]